jgi:hypothetical protein
MGFLAFLVDAGVFKKVLVSHLPVGHTHEDIDQFFSRIAMKLRHCDAHSRLALERIIRFGFRKMGKRPLVKHWDNVANISDWLKKRVVKMTDITAYHQFRMFRAATDAGRVWLQGRRWPGGDDTDHWSGLSRNDFRQGVFVDDVVPNLLSEFAQIPPAQSPTTEATPEFLQKTRESLDFLFRHLGVSPEDEADCNAIFRLLAHPANEDVEFAWSIDDAKLLLDPSREAVPEQAPVRYGPHLDRKRERVSQGLFYLMRPGVEPSMQEHAYPIYLVRVKKLERDDLGQAVCRVQFWDLSAEDQAQVPADATRWFTGKWVPNKMHIPGTRYS